MLIIKNPILVRFQLQALITSLWGLCYRLSVYPLSAGYLRKSAYSAICNRQMGLTHAETNKMFINTTNIKSKSGLDLSVCASRFFNISYGSLFTFKTYTFPWAVSKLLSSNTQIYYKLSIKWPAVQSLRYFHIGVYFYSFCCWGFSSFQSPPDFMPFLPGHLGHHPKNSSSYTWPTMGKCFPRTL